MMRLTINKNSWHYRYHCWIRSMWGANAPKGDTWSLCPYFQITLWGTVFGVILAPLIVTGWILARLFRFFYKISYHTKGLRWIANIFDKTPLGADYEDAPGRFQKAPIVAGLWYTFLSTMTLLTIAAAITAISLLAIFGLDVIPMIPGAIITATSFIWDVALFAGYAIFYLLHMIGHILLEIGQAIASFCDFILGFVLNGSNWIALGKLIAWTIAMIASLVIIGFVGYKATNSKIVNRFFEWIEMRANGYSKARASRSVTLEELKAERAALKTIRKEEKEDLLWAARRAADERRRKANRPRSASALRKLGDLEVGECISIIWSKIYGQERWDDKHNEYVRELGPLGYVWEFIKSVKKQACPVIEFVETNDKNGDSNTNSNIGTS